MEEYAPNLYKEANIIGYTGNIKKNPTVYFNDREKNQYGHITQDHPKPSYIGREIGSTSSNYVMSNSGPNGSLQESIDGIVFHESRNQFKQVTNLKDLEKLALSIDRFKFLKPHNFKNYNEVKSSLETGVSSTDIVTQSLIQFEIDLRKESRPLTNGAFMTPTNELLISQSQEGAKGAKKQETSNKTSKKKLFPLFNRKR